MCKTGVYRYQVHFPELTKEMYEEQRRLYQLLMVYLRLDVMKEKYSYVSEINHRNGEGTTITFRVAETPEELERECQKILKDYEALQEDRLTDEYEKDTFEV